MAALDASKAFDTVNNYCLFLSIVKYNVSLPFLKVIVFWHLHLNGLVRWSGCFLQAFVTQSGVK